MDEEIARLASASGHTPSSLRDELTKNGRLGSLRAAVTKQLAADWVLERVVYVDETGSLVDRSLLEADEDGDDTTEGTGDDTAEPTEQVDQSANEHEEHT